MNLTIISNTCVGQFIMKKKNIFPYNNPFIGSLIPNDLEYIKLINNLEYYINCIPILKDPSKISTFSNQNKSVFYKHKDIKLPYPVIFLGDIEIHFIHENNNKICLEKFIRRLNRLIKNINKPDHIIVITLSFSELINNHNNISDIINEFFKVNDHIFNDKKLNIEKYFLGPLEYYNNNKNYIIENKWNNIILKRDNSHIYEFNDQPFTINIFSEYIN